jgi:hypothetical protein
VKHSQKKNLDQGRKYFKNFYKIMFLYFSDPFPLATSLTTSDSLFRSPNLAKYDLSFSNVKSARTQKKFPRFPELLPPAPKKGSNGAHKMPRSVRKGT